MTLDLLRQNPMTRGVHCTYLFECNHTFERVTTTGQSVEGMPCEITLRRVLSTEVVELSVTATAAGPRTTGQPQDYYFPWIPRGVGWVEAPWNLPVGSIIATGLMNGCSFEATRVGQNIRFHHDADGKHINDGTREGEQLLRINYSNMDPTGAGLKKFNEELPKNLKNPCEFGFSVCAVRMHDAFAVLVMPYLKVGNTHSRPFTGGIKGHILDR